MSRVDTSSFKLTLYAEMSTAAAADALQQNKINPAVFMSPANNRVWIPLSRASADALERACWGAEERGEMYQLCCSEVF